MSENRILDGMESIEVAARFSLAVDHFNAAAGAVLATYTTYERREDAQPPINTSFVAKEGDVYTRLSYPVGSMSALQAIEMELSYIDSPRS